MHHLKSHCGLRKPFKDRMTFLAEYGVDWWITMKHELHGNAPSQVTFIYIALLTTVLCMNDVHWTRSYFRRTLNWTNHLNVNESARSLCQEWMSSTRTFTLIWKVRLPPTQVLSHRNFNPGEVTRRIMQTTAFMGRRGNKHCSSVPGYKTWV